MGDEKFKVMIMGAFVLGIFVFVAMYSGFNLSITGYAVFGNSDQSDFDGGDYADTEYNGTAVVLAGDNLTGSYVSQVFDAGDDAIWNNLSYSAGLPSLKKVYGVDGGGDVFYSLDSGETWSSSQEDYGRTTDTVEMFSDASYLYILSTSNREVWRSSTGDGFAVVNDSFADSALLCGESDGDGNLYIADASGDVYLSDDFGVSWSLQGDANGAATNNPKGMTVDSSGNLYLVDGGASVFSSSNQGQDWVERSSDYGGTLADDLEVDSSGNLYILTNKDIYKSTDSGENWTLINDSFTSYSNDGCRMLVSLDDDFYIADCSGRVFDSSDSGVSWAEGGDLNAAAPTEAKGITEFSQSTSLSFQVRNCSSSDCSGETWQVLDLDSIDLASQYFQYKFNFTSPDSSVSPSVNSVIINYDMVNSAPVLSIVSPVDSLYTHEEIELNFTVNDSDGNLDSCWYSLDEGNNVSLLGCANANFNGSDGAHVLEVYANDSLGLFVSESVSFSLDSTGVSVTVTEPNGVKESRIEIPVNFTVSGNNLTCWYEVETSIGGGIIENTTLINCSDSSFDVASDGDYILFLYVNNSLGSSNFSNTSFSVDTSEEPVVVNPPTTGSSGGGGSGGAISITGISNLDVGPVDVVGLIGEEKNLLISVKNNGRVAANKCSLTADGNYIESNEVFNIGVGEIVEFSFVLSILDSDVENLELTVNCLDDISAAVPLTITIFKPELDVSIKEMSFTSDNEFLIKYTIDSVDDSEHILFFRVLNSAGEVVAEISQNVELKYGEVYEGEASLSFSDIDQGMLKVAIANEEKVSFVEEDFVYGGGSSITGFALFGQNGDANYIGIIIFVFLIIAGFLVRRIWKLKKE